MTTDDADNTQEPLEPGTPTKQKSSGLGLMGCGCLIMVAPLLLGGPATWGMLTTVPIGGVLFVIGLGVFIVRMTQSASEDEE